MLCGLQYYLCLVSVELSCVWLRDSIVMRMVQVHDGFFESVSHITPDGKALHKSRIQLTKPMDVGRDAKTLHG